MLVLVLVLDFTQPVGDAADTRHMFDHERLDVYRLAIEFAAWATSMLEGIPRGKRYAVLKHLDEASTSVALNIAEGNGKRSVADRVRYLEIARGSALESAACLDVLVARRALESPTASDGKATLVGVVSTITKLIESLLHPKPKAMPSTSTSTSTSTNEVSGPRRR